MVSLCPPPFPFRNLFFLIPKLVFSNLNPLNNGPCALRFSGWPSLDSRLSTLVIQELWFQLFPKWGENVQTEVGAMCLDCTVENVFSDRERQDPLDSAGIILSPVIVGSKIPIIASVHRFIFTSFSSKMGRKVQSVVSTGSTHKHFGPLFFHYFLLLFGFVVKIDLICNRNGMRLFQNSRFSVQK